MASCITKKWSGTTTPQARLDVTLNTSASDGDTAVLDWELYYVAHGYAANTSGKAREFTVTIGETKITGSFDIDGVKNTTKIKQGTVNIAKTTSAQNISFSVSFAFNITWSDVYGGTKSATGSISVPALTTYTVSYNANGGTGAPANQIKYHGKTITISTIKPTRTGYSFIGWALSKAEADDGDAYYDAGNTCGKNENLTLYAVWQVNAYSVQYNANGGTGAPAKQTKTYGVTLKLSSVIPTRTNYKFLGWGTSASATAVTYKAGANYTANSGITLYAVWELAYVKPRITNFKVFRCNEDDDSIDDSGTALGVSFDWATDRTVQSMTLSWSPANDGGSVSTTLNASGTSGTYVNQGIVPGFSLETTYKISLTIRDGDGDCYSVANATLPGTLFAVDFIAGGDGVAFGKPAELHNYADFNFVARFRKNQLLENNVVMYGKSTEDKNLALLYINGQDYINIGYGGYRESVGATYLYGNEVRIASRGSIFANGYRLAENKVLWSSTSGYYMMSGQTVTLSEAISDQANGVVLVWSFYEDGAPTNGQFNMFFIPKHFIAAHEGKGISSFLTTASVAYVATKYLYVSDTSIIGYDGNNAEASTTSSGIKVTPKAFVLRYVIGV